MEMANGDDWIKMEEDEEDNFDANVIYVRIKCQPDENEEENEDVVYSDNETVEIIMLPPFEECPSPSPPRIHNKPKSPKKRAGRPKTSEFCVCMIYCFAYLFDVSPKQLFSFPDQENKSRLSNTNAHRTGQKFQKYKDWCFSLKSGTYYKAKLTKQFEAEFGREDGVRLRYVLNLFLRENFHCVSRKIWNIYDVEPESVHEELFTL